MRFTTLLITPIFAFSVAHPAESSGSGNAALAAIYADYWQDQLKHNPEMASALGDARYDDQLSDDSIQAYNAALERSRGFLDRVSAMDTSGLSAEEKHSSDTFVNHLVQEQADADRKPWELAVTETSGLPTELPLLVRELSFTSQANYDHYLERLKKMPAAFEQVATNLMAGMEDGHVLPQASVEKLVAQARALSTSKPEDSLFARPIERFPSSISPANQAADKDAILSAIRRQVLPSYARLAKFLEAQYLPRAAASGAPTQGESQGYKPQTALVLALRAKAEQELGTRFNLEQFRAAVMDAMLLPPETFMQSMNRWIAQQK